MKNVGRKKRLEVNKINTKRVVDKEKLQTQMNLWSLNIFFSLWFTPLFIHQSNTV